MIPTLQTAVYAAYPNAVSIIGNDIDSLVVLDTNEKSIKINQDLVIITLTKLQTEYEAKQQIAEATKQSALNKLAAIGLTPDEIKQLLGV